jgi:hypothetical protein
VGTPAYLLKLESKKDFDRLKGEPLSKSFNGIECVKIVYVIETKKLFYLDSKRYKWHYPFTAEMLGDTDDLEQFNLKNYGNTSARKYILATFNYNTNTSNFFLQFAACDNPSDELINTLFEKVTATFFKGKQFKLLLSSTTLLRRKTELSKKHGVITSDELYKDQNYQPICNGKTTGVLLFVEEDSLKANFNYSGNIIILNGSSNQLPVCRAVITNQFQTPLSHICLLTNNRKTPCAAQKNIFKIDSLRLLAGKNVEVQVTNEHVSIKEVKPDENSKKSRPRKQIKLQADTATKAFAALENLRYKQRKIYGLKACNLAELKRIKFRGNYIYTPEKAFAIPFVFYKRHLKGSGAEIMIKDLLQDSLALKNDSILDLKLKKIRSVIKNTKADSSFVRILNDLCFSKFGRNKVRFRSSSNCEDEEGFNGAGLYTSASGIAGDSAKSIEEAVKKVWASAWTLRSFKERNYFNIEQSGVCMAILVHPAFDSELVNGVAITKNLYRKYDFGFVINMQKGEEEVVSPKKNILCEQVVSFMNNPSADFYNKYRSAEWISFSSLSNNESLISADELLQLSQQLEVIKNHFYNLYKAFPEKEYKDFAMDVEFKLIEKNGKRIFLFKQARPFN